MSMRRFLFDLTDCYPVRFIRQDGRPYIERYYLGTFAGVVHYLHRYVGADGGDQGIHDHPWRWSFGLVLVGGYFQRVLKFICSRHGFITRSNFVGPWRLNWLPPERAHQITAVLPETWSYFAHSKAKVKGWGFHKLQRDVATQEIRGVLYSNPYQDKEDEDPWWLTAPVGALAGREPFPRSF